MFPLRFGPPNRQLYGCLHLPSDSMVRNEGAILCNPFGQEAIRSHRLQRILAERLAREGFHVLRFDFFGTGDSDGDDSEGTIDQWCKDLIIATDVLHQQALITSISWFGIRLGATIAAKASKSSPHVIKQLILWDPILDGKEYIRELADAHVAGIERDYAARWVLNSDIRKLANASADSEALGYPISPELHIAIGKIDTATILEAKAAVIYLLHSEDSFQFGSMNVEKLLGNSKFEFCQTTDSIQWASIEAQNTAIVPADVMQKIISKTSKT